MRGLEEKYFPGGRLISDYVSGGIAGVDLFFVVSGFIMATVTRGAFGRADGIVGFVYSRATRIYPLYWLYSLPLLGLLFVRPDLVNPSQGGQVNLVASFLLLPQPLLPLLMIGWTLVLEVQFYAVLALMLLAPASRFVPLLCLWAALVVGANFVVVAPSALVAYATHPMTLEFIAGCLIGVLLGRVRGRWGRTALTAGLALLFGGWAGYHYGYHQTYPWGWLRLALFGVPSVLIVYGAVAAEQRSSLLFPAPLRAVGDASYSLYLSHMLVTSALALVWSRSVTPGPLSNALALAAIFAAAIAFGLAAFRIIERPLLERLRGRRAAFVAWVLGRSLSGDGARPDPRQG
jgi:peptidoglycan/LPS O-acetylase OafA/YrhL